MIYTDNLKPTFDLIYIVSFAVNGEKSAERFERIN